MLNRRTVAGVGALLLVSPNLVAQERPNIIFIMSDDHAAAAISAYNSRLSKILPTPNIDRLGDEILKQRKVLGDEDSQSSVMKKIMDEYYWR